MKLSRYIEQAGEIVYLNADREPWLAVAKNREIVQALCNEAGTFRKYGEGVLIHSSATVEHGAVLKSPLVVSAGCFIASNAYLRGGVFLGERVQIGPGVEVKSSIVFADTVLAHFNFVGDSLIGSAVNFEAGALIANHWNERKDKAISVASPDGPIATGLRKFGAIVGDRSRIGANAVLSPGTLLEPDTVIARLELVDQTCV